MAAVLRLLDGLPDADAAGLVERLEVAAVDYWDAHPTDDDVEVPFRDETPPVGLVHSVVVTLAELETALQDVDPRWRLDVAMALDDLSDMA